MTSVEDRVHAAMSAAADANLAGRPIRSAPPLRLPSGASGRRAPPVKGPSGWSHLGGAARRRHGNQRRSPSRWYSSRASRTIARGSRATNCFSQPGRPNRPGWRAAPLRGLQWDEHISRGRSDSVTGKLLATIALPVRKGSRTSPWAITAADDDRTFAVSIVTYPTAALQGSGSDHLREGEAGTASWYEVRLAPGAATPARLAPVPVKPRTVPRRPRFRP